MDFKVLMVYPNLSMTSMVPQSIAILSSILREVGIETEVFDTTFYDTEMKDPNNIKAEVFLVKPFDFKDRNIYKKTSDIFLDFKKKVETYRPDLIAISFVEDTFTLGTRLLETIKEYDIPVVAGGVFCTFATDKVAQCEYIDYIIRGEGEYPLRELCLELSSGKNIKHIDNLAYKEDGKLIKNNIRLPININELPFPDYSIFEEQSLYRAMNGKIFKTVSIETQRGCPFSCGYCCSAGNNRVYRRETGSPFFRKKKMSRFSEELEYMVSSIKPELIYFLADVFLMMTDREFEEFCEVYSSYKIPFFMNTRAETVKEERIKNIEELNCIRGNVGIEHGNEIFRKRIINRKISNDEIRRAFAIVGSSNFATAANNIIGFPTETRGLIFDTINLNREVAGWFDSVGCFIFSPYHGTMLRSLAIEKKYIKPDTLADANTLGSSILKMPLLPNEMLTGLQRTFSMYVRFPKSRWDEIRIAEQFTDEGNKMFARLSEEFRETFPVG